MRQQHCSVCGNEVDNHATFCNYCGVALNPEDESKNKNASVAKAEQKAQSRFLAILSFVLILLVLGVYFFRNMESSSSDEVEGQWYGTVYADDGRSFTYELDIQQNGTEISGWGMTSDATGSGDAAIRGTYRNGVLNFEESGGTESGDWVGGGLCYWELDLELRSYYDSDMLTGTYNGIGCDSSGSITLYRAD